MSFTPIDPTAAQQPALGPQQAAARIAELQQMIAAAQGQAPSNGGARFSDALANASQPAATAALAAPTTPYATSTPTNTIAAGGNRSSQYDTLVTAAAQRYGIDPAVLHGLIQQESSFDPSSTSGAGAQGLTQLMPGTASSLGVTNPLDPTQSIDGGAHYLREQLDAFGGDVVKALAAYNAGPGAVKRFGGVPPYAETQDYVKKVLGYANAYRSASGASSTPSVTLS
jgi:soluble lytic murein transglycosylase-like protein